MAEGNGEIIEEMAIAVKTAATELTATTTTEAAETTTTTTSSSTLTATPTATTNETERTPDYPKLVEYGLDKRVSVGDGREAISIRLLICSFHFNFFRFDATKRWRLN